VSVHIRFRFGISISGTSSAVTCDPANRLVVALSIDYTGLKPCDDIVVLDGDVTQSGGCTIMEWTQELGVREALFGMTGKGILAYYVGTSNTLPASAQWHDTMYKADSVSLNPSTLSAQCSNVQLGSGLVASWQVLNRDMLSVTVTLPNRQAW
jgi:hypothetical protein